MLKPDWKTYFRFGLTLFLLYLAIHYWPWATGLFATVRSAATPMILGCAIAYVVNILMSFYETHYFPASNSKYVRTSRRGMCMVAAMLTLVVVVLLVVALVLPQLGSCLSLVFAQLPGAITDFIVWLDGFNILPEDILAPLAAIDWQSKIGQIAKALTSGVGNVMTVVISAASSLFSAVTTALFSIIFSIYLLTGKERLAAQGSRFLRRYLPGRVYSRLMYVLRVLNDCFHRFIVGQCTEAVILGALCTIGMMLLGLPYATMVGALIAFTALIPVVGAFIGGGVGAFVILMESPIQALIFLVFLVILQQLEGNLIYPRVVGTSIGLPGIWVLAVVTIGGGTFGILGMLLGVPLAAAAYRLLREDINRPH